MYARDMNDRDTQLAAIPIDFVVKQGLQEHTEGKRRPYSTLIRSWAKDQGQAELGEEIASRLNTGKEPEKLKDLRNLPNSVAPKYRTGDKAEQLVAIVRKIDEKIHNDSNWKWALVMKVMLDEGILITNIPNKFDRLISSMIPGKGIDTVRKSGDYDILEESRSWRNWISNPRDDWKEATKREICKEIYGFLKPLVAPVSS